jgi:hypothetical protein
MYSSTSWRWVVSFTPLPLYPRERVPGTHFIGGWVDSRASLDDMEKWRFFYPTGTRTPASLVVQPVVSRYTDWAIPAPIAYDNKIQDLCLCSCVWLILQCFHYPNYSVEEYDIWWVTNWKGFARKRSWPNWDIATAFAWKAWGKLINTSVRIAGFPTKIHTHQLSNTSLERYLFAKSVSFGFRLN